MICVVTTTPDVAFIYCLVGADGRPRYVGWSKDPAARLSMHWRQRRHKRRHQQNPGLCDWLAGMLFRPPVKVLQVVPYRDRFAAEREWTSRLAVRHPLYNISFGAAPLVRGPLSVEHREKIRRTQLRRSRELRAAA